MISKLKQLQKTHFFLKKKELKWSGKSKRDQWNNMSKLLFVWNYVVSKHNI